MVRVSEAGTECREREGSQRRLAWHWHSHQSRVNSDSQRTADMMSLKIVTILIAASVLLTEVNVYCLDNLTSG